MPTAIGPPHGLPRLASPRALPDSPDGVGPGGGSGIALRRQAVPQLQAAPARNGTAARTWGPEIPRPVPGRTDYQGASVSIPTYQPAPTTTAIAESVPVPVPAEEWELDTTVTRAPTPIVEACGTGDGCAKTCASSCASS